MASLGVNGKEITIYRHTIPDKSRGCGEGGGGGGGGSNSVFIRVIIVEQLKQYAREMGVYCHLSRRWSFLLFTCTELGKLFGLLASEWLAYLSRRVTCPIVYSRHSLLVLHKPVEHLTAWSATGPTLLSSLTFSPSFQPPVRVHQ